MVEAGLVVTINSDDPPMFGTDLTNEYAVAAELLDLDEAGVAELARTAVRVSFAEDSVKNALLAEIDDVRRQGADGAVPGCDVVRWVRVRKVSWGGWRRSG